MSKIKLVDVAGGRYRLVPQPGPLYVKMPPTAPGTAESRGGRAASAETAGVRFVTVTSSRRAASAEGKRA